MTLQDIDVGRRPIARVHSQPKGRRGDMSRSLAGVIRDLVAEPGLRRLLRRAASYDDALVIAGVEPTEPTGDPRHAVALVQYLVQCGEVIGHGPEGRTFLLLDLNEGAFLSLCGFAAEAEDLEDTGDAEPDFDNEPEPEHDARCAGWWR